jgi:hypothetical protein
MLEAGVARMWMKNAYLHRLYARSRLFRVVIMNLTAWTELRLLRGHKDRATLERLRRVRRGRESLLSASEAFMVHSTARAQATLSGEMAEVGVYQGCSARLISEASGGVPLHLFDTFAGLPAPERAEARHLSTSQYASSLESVRSYLAECPNVEFYPGLFPETGATVVDLRFSFVHLDVDLKSSTRACLEFFYPRLVAGGIILSHDYSYLDGVREAFAEFCRGRSVQLIELPTSQAMVIAAA